MPGWLQAVTLATCLASAGVVSYVVVGYFHVRHAPDTQTAESSLRSPALSSATERDVGAEAQQQNAAIATMRDEIATLKERYAALNDQSATLTNQLNEARNALAAMSAENGKLRGNLGLAEGRAKTLEQARNELDQRARAAEQALNSKSGNVTQLSKNLDENRSELRESEAQRTTLQNRLQRLDMDLQAANARAAQLSSAVEAKEHQLQALTAERDRIRAQLKDQGGKVTTADPPAAPEASPLPQDAKVPTGSKADSGERAQANSGDLEQLIASTGINIDRLLSRMAALPPGQGGPYVALDSGKFAEQHQRRLEDLKNLVKLLPLTAPLAHYQLESGFGSRVDPFNHRSAFHAGLDLAAPYKSLVYSTAPGVVAFTGVKDAYGRVVDIDHGHGIVTRYAHLNRILVARGQKVGVHTEIGLLGSTGRSTGPHVHYEILVDGVPQDPAKFIEAGKNVVQVSSK